MNKGVRLEMTKVELYSAQSKSYLEKFRSQIEGTNREVEDVLTYVLECKEKGVEPLNCQGACDGSCKEKCLNL